MGRPLKPRKGAYVATVSEVKDDGSDGQGGVILTPVDRAGNWVVGTELTDDYAVIVGHPMEALGGYPAPERYTAEGVNRPPVCFAYVGMPGPDMILTDDVINDLADQGRAMLLKRLKDQAAMEQGARDN